MKDVTNILLFLIRPKFQLGCGESDDEDEDEGVEDEGVGEFGMVSRRRMKSISWHGKPAEKDGPDSFVVRD